MSDTFLRRSIWTVPYNEIDEEDVRRIQEQGTERAQALRQSVNEVQNTLNQQLRVDGDIAQARAKVDGWNTGYQQNQRPILSEAGLDLLSTRYPYFKKSYVSIDSRLRDTAQFPRPNQYSIYLNNTFENCQRITLLDFETLAPSPTIRPGNRQISWAYVPDYNQVSLNFFIQDQNPIVTPDVAFGDYYQVRIPEGFYNTRVLKDAVENAMNSQIRRPTRLDNTTFFNDDFLGFQDEYNLKQPVVWTRDTDTNSYGEQSLESYRPVFHLRMTPEQGEVAFTCRSEERTITQIRTQAGKPWIEFHLGTDARENPTGLRVASVELTSFGNGYVIPPTVEFVGGGDPSTPATAVTTVSNGIVFAFSPVNKGSGYTANPSVTINPGSGGFTTVASANAFVGILKTITILPTNVGNGYGATPNYIISTTNNQPGDGFGAVLNVQVFSSRILDITIDSFGSLFQQVNYNIYFQSNQIPGNNISAGEDPFHARATATVVAGAVTNVAITWPGTGYTDDVRVIIIGNGLGATAEPVVENGRIIDVNITNPGAGYTFALVYFAGGTIDAFATATASTPGEVETVIVTSQGSGYTNTTTATISPPTSGIQAVYNVQVLVAGQLSSITLTNPGSEYSSTPEVRFSSSEGSGAAAVATMEFEDVEGQEVNELYQEPFTSVAQVVIPPDGGGSGYDPLNPPSVYFLGGGGTGATATAVVSDDSEDGTFGQIIYIAVTNGGSGYLTSPRVIIDAPPGPGETAQAFALLGNQFGPPVIMTGWREAGLEIGGFNYEWVEEVEFFPYYNLKGFGEDIYQTAPASNNILVPVFAPVYQIAGTTEEKNQLDPFDWDYPNVQYVPSEEFVRFQVSRGIWIRKPGVYRLHPLLYDNVQNVFRFGVANRSQILLDDPTTTLSGPLGTLRVGRGMPFKWVTTRRDLNATETSCEGAVNGNTVNTNLNIDGSLASLLPLLGFTLNDGDGNESVATVRPAYRCVWKNYDDYQVPNLQTLVGINRILNKNPPIDYIAGTPFIKIPFVPIAPNRYAITRWPNFVLSHGGHYLLVGESYFYLRLRIPDRTSAPVSQNFYVGSSNLDAGSNANKSLYTNPISLNETVLLNQGPPSTKQEEGNLNVNVYPPLTSVETQKSFDFIFAKVKIPFGRTDDRPVVIPFSNDFPEELIRRFDRLIIELVDYEGKVIDTRCDHSFVLEIHERKDTMKEAYLSTQIGDVPIAGGASRVMPQSRG
jgi:hypothetical protein